jgi:hypothetical protein
MALLTEQASFIAARPACRFKPIKDFVESCIRRPIALEATRNVPKRYFRVDEDAQ